VPNSEKDRLAAEVEDRWVEFQDGLAARWTKFLMAHPAYSPVPGR
jgi:hypothetical protein